MRIERFVYKPFPRIGYDLKQTLGTNTIVSEDIIKDLYTIENPTLVSHLHNTLQGPVISITKVEKCQDDGKREAIHNTTLFFRVSDLVDFLLPLLDAPQPLPLQTLELNKWEDLWKYQSSVLNQSPLQEEAESNGPQSFS